MFAPSRINTMASLINREAFISLCISGLQPKLIRKKFAVPFLREIGLAVLLFFFLKGLRLNTGAAC